MSKTLINYELSGFYKNAYDYVSDQWTGDISFEEIEQVSGLNLLRFKDGNAKILDVSTGDIFWCKPSGYEDEMVIL